MDLILPFKIGDFAESKSFVEGFRGAWFRSKINDMRVTESGHLEYYLQYIDYTEDDNEWIEVFQENPLNPASQKRKSSVSSQIMLRPPFPKWYRGDKVPEHFSKNELIASVRNTWKVGDCVDWHCSDCYWTGKIVKLISDDVVEVVLSGPPVGEGGPPQQVNQKDLRPALDWSIIEGWTVPLSTANGKRWYAARLTHPKSDIEESNTNEDEAPEKLRPTSTHKSSDPSQREPNRPSNGTGARRYPLRVRKLVKKALVNQK